MVDFDSIAGQIKAPWGSLQDLRPGTGSTLIDATCDVPPDPFFDHVSFCGALENGPLVIIPWNEPGPVAQLTAQAPAAPFGYLYVLVASNQIGPIGGAQVAASNFLGISDITGYARMYVPAGFVAFALTNLPPGCANPGVFFVNVPPNGSAGQTAVVPCNT
jgi:hypothetical protein